MLSNFFMKIKFYTICLILQFYIQTYTIKLWLKKNPKVISERFNFNYSCWSKFTLLKSSQIKENYCRLTWFLSSRKSSIWTLQPYFRVLFNFCFNLLFLWAVRVDSLYWVIPIWQEWKWLENDKAFHNLFLSTLNSFSQINTNKPVFFQVEICIISILILHYSY